MNGDLEAKSETPSISSLPCMFIFFSHFLVR